MTCTECGSTWTGYHSYTFCLLVKAGFRSRFPEPTICAMAKVADHRAIIYSTAWNQLAWEAFKPGGTG